MSHYDVAAYIWPAYTGDEPRSHQFWPEGYGEWQSVRSATAKFEGHGWPRRPLWGYQNEADRYVMQMQIDAATDHAVDNGGKITATELVEALGFDSLSHYQYVHFTNIDRDYADILPDVVAEWQRVDSEYRVPYFPHVSVGWDNNPRGKNKGVSP